ncbi:MAG: hypothetical protein LBR11_08155 [Deltaproteobacteria bacterium]|jgi:hypothetical protein|nr:hypothetical protein [Deltaproteobacteria bacterium]
MATTSGIATGGADDMIGILINFVKANGWQQLDHATEQVNTETTIDCYQLKGTDVSGQGNIYVHIIYRKQTTQDIFAFELEGSAGYLPSADVKQFGQNPQNSYRDTGTTSSVIVRVPLHRNPIQYWLTASPRRFMGAFRHNERWGALYCGFIMPYGLPTQYPYPLWIAGNNITTNDYKTIVNGCPWGASNVISGMLYCPSGRWQSTPLTSGPAGGRGLGIPIWPYKASVASQRMVYYKPLKDSSNTERYALMKQIFYCSNASEYGTFGEPEGLSFVTGWGAAGGDILTHNGQNWLLVQREMSSANETSAAMLLE